MKKERFFRKQDPPEAPIETRVQPTAPAPQNGPPPVPSSPACIERPASTASAEAASESATHADLDGQNDSLFVSDDEVAEVAAPRAPPAGPSPEPDRLSQIGYDLFKSQISSIIGDASETALRHLHAKYFNRPNYIQLASNEYFNGIVYDHAAPDSGARSPSKDEQVKVLVEQIRTQAQLEAQEKERRRWRRYIGTLDVEAWATRPYLRPLQYEQPLEVKRLLPNKIKKSSMVAPKFGDSAVIRLYTVDDAREIGRLPEDVTRILSPLIDLDLAAFEACVIMGTSGRLSIGDSFYLQIKCYLNSTTFAENVPPADDGNAPKRKKHAKPASFNFTSETEGEAALRLKQKAVSRLFQKLRIVPVNKASDAVTAVDDDGSAPPTPSKADAQTQPSSESPTPTDDLNLDQLKEFYTSNQQSDVLENLPETTTPPSRNFKLTLRPYQKNGLAWMLSREKELDVLEELSVEENQSLSTQKRTAIRNQGEDVINPLWSIFRWPRDLSVPEAPSENEYFYANLYNGEFSIDKPLVKNFLKGGVLADEMGLGKTISTLALVHSVPYDTAPAPTSFRKYASKSTLVVVPMSLLTQWKAEFDRSNNNPNHKCMIYYGDSVQTDLSVTLCNRENNIPILVLTTYGTVQSEWARINKMRDENGRLPRIGLYSVEFLRIVLDEGHNIRNRTTKTAKSVHELMSARKWVLTGTPVVNRLDDIFSLVKFLRLEPWCNFSYWKTFVTLPFEQKQFNVTLDVVKSILQPIFLRRTKNMKSKDGTPLVHLPEKEIVIEELSLSEREQLYYDFFRSRAYQSFNEGIKSGDLLKRYTQILTHILRLRQVCCHPDLVKTSNELDETWEEELANFDKPMVAEKFASETAMKQVMYGLYAKVKIEDSECSICTQAPIAFGELTLTECGHQYCLHCLMEHISFQRSRDSEPLCPECRHPISKHRLFKLNPTETSRKEVRFHVGEQSETRATRAAYPFSVYHYNPDKTSAKINALVSHLRDLKQQSPGEHVVVFSQFSTYLDLIEAELKTVSSTEEYVVYKFDGRLNMNEREKVLQKFTAGKADARITILLLSLKSGGVGLNLTRARHVFMMDPWWSPSIEDQAIDRVHRIGQDSNVKVVRFVVADSIEKKMLRIQERKRMMGEAVEVEEEERRKQRIEEIKLLFDD